jgi:hypothetical protein
MDLTSGRNKDMKITERINKVVAVSAIMAVLVMLSMTLNAAAFDFASQWNGWIAAGTTTVIIAGVAAVVVYLYTRDAKKGTLMRTGGTIATVVLVVVMISALFGVTMKTGTVDEGDPNPNPAGVIWDTTFTSNATADGFCTFTSANRCVIVWSDEGNTSFYINGTTQRQDSGSAWAYTTVEVTSIGVFENETTGIETSIVSKTSGLFDCTFENSDGDTANMKMTIPPDEARAESWSCLIELNEGTLGAMDSMEMTSITLVAGGEALTIDIQHA